VLSDVSQLTSCSLTEDGRYLLASSRFLPAKLLDLRTGRVLVKYKNSGAVCHPIVHALISQ
jgi:hypothetical protein